MVTIGIMGFAGQTFKVLPALLNHKQKYQKSIQLALYLCLYLKSVGSTLVLKSIHWVNSSAQSSLFEKHIILTKPFKADRADISCHFMNPCAELFTQWMDFSILSIVFLGITKSQLGPSQSTISISAKYCSFESRQGSRIRAANPSKCSSINQVSKALERLLGWI